MMSVDAVEVISLIAIRKLLRYFGMHCLAVQTVARLFLWVMGCSPVSDIIWWLANQIMIDQVLSCFTTIRGKVCHKLCNEKNQ